MKRSLPKVVLVHILRRLPPSAQCRASLVCRLWRKIIGEVMKEMEIRAKLLLWNTRSAVAYVVDDLSPSSTGSRRELWRGGTNQQLVGTSNGLLCLCDNSCGSRPGGDVTLVNPATRETLAIPPLPHAGELVGHHREATRWDKAYSFACHPRSRRYKVGARLVGGRVPSRRTERAVTASPDRKGKENLDPPIHPRAGAAEVPRI
jgi:hypothetical protein